MGLTPAELEQYTYAQFELKCKGFFDLRIDDENYFRKLTYHLYAINVSADSRANLDIDDLWPNANTIKKAEVRNDKAKSKVYSIMLERFKQNKGLT